MSATPFAAVTLTATTVLFVTFPAGPGAEAPVGTTLELLTVPGGPLTGLEDPPTLKPAPLRALASVPFSTDAVRAERIAGARTGVVTTVNWTTREVVLVPGSPTPREVFALWGAEETVIDGRDWFDGAGDDVARADVTFADVAFPSVCSSRRWVPG